MGNPPQVLTQVCLAHLIRDLTFITTRPDQAAARWGHKMLAGMRRLFGAIHRRDAAVHRSDRMTDDAFGRAMTRARDALLNRARRGSPRREVQNLIARFRKGPLKNNCCIRCTELIAINTCGSVKCDSYFFTGPKHGDAYQPVSKGLTTKTYRNRSRVKKCDFSTR